MTRIPPVTIQLNFDAQFMGKSISYWIELDEKAKLMGYDVLVDEIVDLKETLRNVRHAMRHESAFCCDCGETIDQNDKVFCEDCLSKVQEEIVKKDKVIDTWAKMLYLRSVGTVTCRNEASENKPKAWEDEPEDKEDFIRMAEELWEVVG